MLLQQGAGAFTKPRNISAKTQTHHPTLNCRVMVNTVNRARDRIENWSQWQKYAAHVRDLRVEHEVLQCNIAFNPDYSHRT